MTWPEKHREVWFSLRENHEKAYRFGLHQLRNCSARFLRQTSTAAQRIRGMDSEGDGLSETTFENSIPGRFVPVGHRKIGISAYSWGQKGVCVKSSDIFCMYFLELNFLPVDAPDI